MTASVLVALDTRPPTLAVTVLSQVQPPDDLEVLIEADEPLGVVGVAVTDVLGTLVNLGYERLDARTVLAVLPTVGLATGPATIRLSVADEVLNFTQQSHVVTIERPRAFDVELTLVNTHEVALTVNGGYEVELTVENGHEADLYLDDAYEPVLDLEPAHQITLEVY